MGLGDFIKNGGLFGKMRGFNSEREGHWYGFDECIADIKKCSEAVVRAAEIPVKVETTLCIEDSAKQNLITFNGSETRRIEK